MFLGTYQKDLANINLTKKLSLPEDRHPGFNSQNEKLDGADANIKLRFVKNV